MAIPLRFTKKSIENLPLPERGRVTYRDYDRSNYVGRTTVAGLQLTVSSTGTASFLLCKKFKGRVKKITIGRFPECSVELARSKAMELLTQLNKGIDPIQARRAERDRGVIVEQAVNDYLESKESQLAETTIKGYRMSLNSHLADWKKKPMKDISGNMVEKLHKEITVLSPNSANSSMKLLRAVFNYGKSRYFDIQGQPVLTLNPVDHLSQFNLWNKQKRRESKIYDSQLKDLHTGLSTLKSSSNRFAEIAAYYFEFQLFTGARKAEASTLKIEDINFFERAFTFHKTKNGKVLTLPMSNHIEKLLRHCCYERTSGYVFEGHRPCGHINEPQKELDLLRSLSNIKFSCHDFRRTFISISESLEISSFALKQLVNHSPGSDVTAGYVIMDIKRKRKLIQKVTDHILYYFENSESREAA